MSKTFASYWNLASKAVCVGRNYVAHVKELNNTVPSHPFFFLKPASAFLPLKGDVVIPGYGEDLHHEVELCVIIGRNAKDVKAKDAMDYVAGYSVGLDMTLRDVQNEKKKKSTQGDLDNLTQGRKTITGMFKTNDANTMVNKIENVSSIVANV